VEVLVAQDAATLDAHPTLDQVHATMALVAVRGDLRASEELDFLHEKEDDRARGVRNDDVRLIGDVPDFPRDRRPAGQ
jgi:hypothetical protein